MDDLFEYLAVRIEVEKDKLCKEVDDVSRGRIKELSELLDMFAHSKSVIE